MRLSSYITYDSLTTPQEVEQAGKRVFNIQSKICFVSGNTVYGSGLWPALTDQAKEDAKLNKTIQLRVATIVE